MHCLQASLSLPFYPALSPALPLSLPHPRAIWILSIQCLCVFPLPPFWFTLPPSLLTQYIHASYGVVVVYVLYLGKYLGKVPIPSSMAEWVITLCLPFVISSGRAAENGPSAARVLKKTGRPLGGSYSGASAGIWYLKYRQADPSAVLEVGRLRLWDTWFPRLAGERTCRRQTTTRRAGECVML